MSCALLRSWRFGRCCSWRQLWKKVGRRDCLDLRTVRTARIKRDPLVICRHTPRVRHCTSSVLSSSAFWDCSAMNAIRQGFMQAGINCLVETVLSAFCFQVSSPKIKCPLTQLYGHPDPMPICYSLIKVTGFHFPSFRKSLASRLKTRSLKLTTCFAIPENNYQHSRHATRILKSA